MSSPETKLHTPNTITNTNTNYIFMFLFIVHMLLIILAGSYYTAIRA